MDFEKTLKDIKSIKIQGAENIAKAASAAILSLVNNSVSKHASDLKSEITKAYERLKNARPTEPMMRNCMWYLCHDLSSKNVEDILRNITIRYNEISSHLKSSIEKIAYMGSLKIKKGMVVYTHCHSSTVVSILKKAKDRGVSFEVHVTETRPKYQGRITAKELYDYGIPVRYYVDSAARMAIKKADIMLIGSDAITSTGKVINKVGSEMFAEIANKFDVPVYACTDSWKFDPLTIFGYDEEIERRDPEEFWSGKPIGLKIDSFIFEKIDPELISGIISELGIFKPFSFGDELKRVYPWIMKVR